MSPPNSINGGAWTTIGDAQSAVLGDGRFMMANCCTSEEAILDPVHLTWTTLPTTGKEDENDEEGWTVLPDGRLLTVDANGTTTAKLLESELFNPTTNKWTSGGSTLVKLDDTTTDANDSGSHELGPRRAPLGLAPCSRSARRTHNAIFNSATNTWTRRPRLRERARRRGRPPPR